MQWKVDINTILKQLLERDINVDKINTMRATEQIAKIALTLRRNSKDKFWECASYGIWDFLRTKQCGLCAGQWCPTQKKKLDTYNDEDLRTTTNWIEHPNMSKNTAMLQFDDDNNTYFGLLHAADWNKAAFEALHKKEAKKDSLLWPVSTSIFNYLMDNFIHKNVASNSCLTNVQISNAADAKVNNNNNNIYIYI